MLRYSELQQNPISVTVRDQTGTTFAVGVERFRRGFVKMTCECPRLSAAGWCQHCLAVFSDGKIFKGNKQRQAFQHIVGGTFLESAANKLTKSLDAFAVAYRQMKFDRPADLDPSQLNSFADQAYRAGETAGHLAQALENFIEELRLRPSAFSVAGRDVENASSDHPPNLETQNSSWHKESEHAKLPNSPEQRTTMSDPTDAFSGNRDMALELVRNALEKELE